MNYFKNNKTVLFLIALAITVFMMLPRMVIVVYVKANPHLGIDEITWLDFSIKFLYSFLIAWIFLWININRFAIKPLNTFKRTHRLLLNIVLLIVIKYIFKILGIPEEKEAVSLRATVFLFNISLITEAAFCIFASEIYTLLISNQQEKLNNEKLLKANTEATFEALKTQVNPHFLFNSLNTINAMIDNDAKAAKKFVSNMSHVYRYLLSSTAKPVITLAEEMEFTTAYINMLLERHTGSLFVNNTIPYHFYSYLLPPVSIQLLVENAVKHNVVSIRSPLTITIKIEEGRLIVSNTINIKKQINGSTGTGLYNLSQRYLYLCNMEIGITKTDEDFSVSIPLLETFEEPVNTPDKTMR